MMNDSGEHFNLDETGEFTPLDPVEEFKHVIKNDDSPVEILKTARRFTELYKNNLELVERIEDAAKQAIIDQKKG